VPQRLQIIAFLGMAVRFLANTAVFSSKDMSTP